MATRGVDFTQFKEYAKNWRRSYLELEAFLVTFLVEQAERLIGETKDRTPVDTGHLRDSWQIGEIRKSGMDLEIEILNGADYASHVEYGHETRSGGFVDGRFMLTISMDRIYAAMPARFNKAFHQFLAERGVA